MPKRKIDELENGNIRITIPLIFRTMANRRKIVVPDSEQSGGGDPLVVAIARGRRWQALIDEGRFANVKELAKSIGRDAGNVAGVIRLSMLAPTVIHKIISGDYPSKLSLESLRGPIPEIWDDQFEYLFKAE